MEITPDIKKRLELLTGQIRGYWTGLEFIPRWFNLCKPIGLLGLH